MVLGAILILGFVSSFIWRLGLSDRKIIQLNFIGILAGLVFEYKRICKKWSTVLWTALGAFLLSFLLFASMRSKTGHSYDDDLQFWPYYFLGTFILIATFVQFTNVTKKVNEGISLLFTIAFNYWVIANDYWNSNFLIIKLLILASFVFSAFSVSHALSYREFSKAGRVILSTWIAIIILILSIDNFLKIYQFRDIEHLSSFSESIFVFLQFFLLGISGVYIVHNITLVVSYFFGIHAIREINDVHLSRFQNEQVYIIDAIIVIILSLVIFSLNYYFHYLPTNFVIWATILVMPLLHYLMQRLFL